MCGGGPDIDTSYQDFQLAEAERARLGEKAREQRLREGLAQIAAVFEGGEYARPQSFSEVINLNEGGDPKDAEWSLTAMGPRGAAKTYAGVQPILDQRREAMEGFYYPQLDDQAADARDQLTFALQRAGLLDSTAAGEKQADLQTQLGLERGNIASRIARDLAGQRTRMNQYRSSIESGLRASGDATRAANEALQAAVTFRDDMPDLNPIGNVFGGIAQGIGAYRQGFETGRIRRMATPKPLDRGTGRVVGG